MNPFADIDSQTPIGWIGTGVMGVSMAGHLLDAGYKLTVFNRTPAKAQSLVDRGARLAETPAEVARNSRVVFTIVGYPADVDDVYRNPETGILSATRPGMILIDMTTSRPSLAVELAEAARALGAAAIDAPVSGGDIGARNAALSIMVGGEDQPVAAAEKLFAHLGKTIVHQGPAGCGQHTKMVNQTLIASGMIAICEALLYADRVGLDLPTVLKSVSGGAASSWSLLNLAPRIIQGDFEPGFYVEHFIKDMGIALEETKRMGIQLPGLELAYRLYQTVAADGWSRKGTQSLYLSLSKSAKHGLASGGTR
jgi:3-hydroxyisobutyrate dehydrogenase